MPRAQTYLIFSLAIRPALHNHQKGNDAIFFKTDFAKQVLSNSNLSLSLYAPNNLAGLFDRKSLPLDSKFSKILKSTEEQDSWSVVINHLG